MRFEFDPSFISHVAVRLDGTSLKSFLDNLGNVSFQEAESYLSNLIKGNYEQDDFTVGLKVKPKNHNQTELLGHLYKNSAFQSVSTEVSDLDTQNMHNDIAQFVQSYANVADLQYNSNFLDKQTFKHEKTLDSYIFTELMLQFTNNNTVKFRVDGEYVTVINTELTSKYIYFNDNKNKRICKFLSKNMHPAYLESFL